jgi:PEP-CTERM motif
MTRCAAGFAQLSGQSPRIFWKQAPYNIVEPGRFLGSPVARPPHGDVSMMSSRLVFTVLASVVALALAATPAWAGSSGTSVTDTSGFGTQVDTLTTNGIAGGDVDFNVTATVFQCQNASGCSNGGGTAAFGEYTYVYSVTPTGNSAPLSQISVGNLLGLFLTGNTNYGVVTSLTTMTDSGATTFTLGGSGDRVNIPTCGADTCLTVGTTLTFYIQSYGAPSSDTISAQDGGTSAFGGTLGPVPEPASMALFGSGLAFLGGAIRRRRS